MSECEKNINKQKCGKYIYRFYVKIWYDLNDRLAVAQDNNRNKEENISMKCKSEGMSVRKKWINRKVEKDFINIIKKRWNDLNKRLRVACSNML